MTKTPIVTAPINAYCFGRLSSESSNAPGTPENPLDTSGVSEKARILMAPVLGAAKTERLIRRVIELETLADARDLRALITR